MKNDWKTELIQELLYCSRTAILCIIPPGEDATADRGFNKETTGCLGCCSEMEGHHFVAKHVITLLYDQNSNP